MSGAGWVSVSPVEIEGTPQWLRAVDQLRVEVHGGERSDVTVRPPMLPFEASGTRPREWATEGDSQLLASRVFDKSGDRADAGKRRKKGRGGRES